MLRLASTGRLGDDTRDGSARRMVDGGVSSWRIRSQPFRAEPSAMSESTTSIGSGESADVDQAIERLNNRWLRTREQRRALEERIAVWQTEFAAAQRELDDARAALRAIEERVDIDAQTRAD